MSPNAPKRNCGHFERDAKLMAALLIVAPVAAVVVGLVFVLLHH
jgi:hypothetical protein